MEWFEEMFTISVFFEGKLIPFPKTSLFKIFSVQAIHLHKFVVKEFGAIEGGTSTLQRLAEHLDQM